jgi:hypothetical protein
LERQERDIEPDDYHHRVRSFKDWGNIIFLFGNVALREHGAAA